MEKTTQADMKMGHIGFIWKTLGLLIIKLRSHENYSQHDIKEVMIYYQRVRTKLCYFS